MVAGGDIAASDATPAGWVISVLTSLVPVEGTPEEKEELLFSTLVPAHLPLVAQIYPGKPPPSPVSFLNHQVLFLMNDELF